MSERNRKYKAAQFSAVFSLVLILGIMTWDLVDSFQEWTKSEGDDRRMNEALFDSVQGDLDYGPLDERELAELDSDRYFNPGRLMGDPAYRLQVRKHVCIQQYLDSPRRNDPNYEAVLYILLKNGYGISDWVTTCRNIMAWQLPFHIRRENLVEGGYSQEVIDENLRVMHKLREGDLALIKEALIHDVGITNQGVLDELMSIRLIHERRERPFGGSFSALTGDLLLTDEDWMNDEHRASQASYEGEPRKRLTESERTSWYRSWKAAQLGIHDHEVPPLNRKYVGFNFPPIGWQAGDPLELQH